LQVLELHAIGPLFNVASLTNAIFPELLDADHLIAGELTNSSEDAISEIHIESVLPVLVNHVIVPVGKNRLTSDLD